MAQDDLFIDEVKAGVRSDNARNFLTKYRWILLAIVLGVVGFVAFMSFSSRQKINHGQAQYNALSASVAEASPTEQEAATREADLSQMGGELPDLEAARLARASGDEAQALSYYDQIENDKSASNTMKEFAKLQSYSLEGGEETPLANPGAAFMIEAKLIEADRLVGEGKTDDAIVVLQALLANPEVRSERAFIESVVIALGGEIEVEGAVDAPAPSQTAPSDAEEETKE